jgi:hypothetical protein
MFLGAPKKRKQDYKPDDFVAPDDEPIDIEPSSSDEEVKPATGIFTLIFCVFFYLIIMKVAS